VSSIKRCRQDALSPVQSQADLERVVETQSNEIEYLKTAKANLESSLASLKSEQEKTLHENRILKRAVTIQQERQNHASNDLEAARQYKVQAEENIRRLEQMILSLRYHLSAQHHPANDFMGFPPQPPDVY
jgi:thioesterase domain-containing protein